MGVKLNDQANGEEYRYNLAECMKLVTQRVINPLLFKDFIFKFSKIYRNMSWYSKKLHQFSMSVINQRRISYQTNNLTAIKSEKVEKENMFVKLILIYKNFQFSNDFVFFS